MPATTDIAHKISTDRRYYVGYCAAKFGLSVFDAEDLVSESSYNALKYCDKLDDLKNFHRWFLRILRNTFINGYRNSVKMQTYSLEFAIVKGTDPDNESADLLRFIRSRNIRHFELLVWSASGYGYDELAKAYRLPVGTVKNRIFTARQEAIRIAKH
jgi:RNA polymerase sigma-70 factor (ECF subfamily)